MEARNTRLKRRIRSAGGNLLRRLGMLPGGIPDGLGDDARLEGKTLTGEALAFFPDTSDSLYQLRGWFGPLREIHDRHGLTIVCMDSRVARQIREESSIPVITIAQDSTLDALVARSDIKIIFYVNYNPLNMLALRIRSAIHVSLLHGDSDKSVSVSNQVKAYDFSFVAGQAAVDRFKRYTSLFDADSRCIIVGRPALDLAAGGGTETAPKQRMGEDSPPVVLYAPTWEGGHPSVAYGSVETHGPDIVRSLIDEGLRVVYRPHPLTGVREPAYAAADARIRELLNARGTVSTGSDILDDFSEADLLICDVSAVANDWLTTEKPLIITEPEQPATKTANTKLLDSVPRLNAAQAGSAGGIAREQMRHDPGRARRLDLIEYYVGERAPGASVKRFLDAYTRLAELRDREWARIGANET